jgi:hypothetical protein
MHPPIFEWDAVELMKISNLTKDRLPINPGGIVETVVNGTEKDRTAREELIRTAAIHVEARSASRIIEVPYPTSDDIRLGQVYRPSRRSHHVGKGDVVKPSPVARPPRDRIA